MKIREEFRVRHLIPSHPRTDLFYSAQWNWPRSIFVAYRVIIALYVDFWLLYSAIKYSGWEPRFNWAVWLTNWSLFLLGAHLTLSAAIVCFHNFEHRAFCCKKDTLGGNIDPDENTESAFAIDSTDVFQGDPQMDDSVAFVTVNSLPWYIRLSWIVYNTIAVMAPIVTIVYFGILYPQIKNNPVSLLLDFHMHGLNTIIILFEMIVSAVPIKILHVIYPISYGLIYIIFSAIFWAQDHTNVLYPGVLDWNNPGQTIMMLCILALIVVPLFQFLFYGMYRLRLMLYLKLHYTD